MDKILRRLRKSFIFILVIVIFLQYSAVTVLAGFNSVAEIESSGRMDYVVKIGNALVSKGFGKKATYGVLANINSESAFDPNLVEAGNGIGFGLVQWSFGRRTQFENFINSKYNGDFKNLEAQVEFLNYELETSLKGEMNASFVNSQLARYGLSISGKAPNSWEEFKNMDNAEDAAKIFMVIFERPSENASVNHWQQRVNMAKELEAALDGKLSGGSSSSESSSSDSEGSSDSVASIQAMRAKTYGIVQEYELVGMVKRETLVADQKEVKLADGSNLSIAQSNNLISIKQDIYNRDKFSILNFLRTCVAFIGILFAVWGILLLVAYIFDRSNVFIELSLVSIVTAGRMTVYAFQESDERSATTKKILNRVFASMVTSFLLISGTLYVGLSDIYFYLQDLIG